MAGPLFYDRVRETAATTGTGTFTLLGAVRGYQAFSVVGNGNTCFYCIDHQAANEWEVGVGTYTSSGTTLARTEVIASSNSGAAVSFTAGTKQVFLTSPAEANKHVWLPPPPGGRLTLDSVLPVTTSDTTSSTLYYLPYLGNRIDLWNGQRWAPVEFATASLGTLVAVQSTATVSTVSGSKTVSMVSTTGLYVGQPVTGTNIAAGSVITAILGAGSVDISANATGTGSGITASFYFANYDVFGYLSSGVLALEILGWTNNTTRATAVTYQDGRLCKSGDKTRLYLGTMRVISTTASTDSVSQRFVWNNYNRVDRHLSRGETTDSWTYGSSAWRAANANTANSVSYVCGASEDPVEAVILGNIAVNSGENGMVGVGVDSSTANSALLWNYGLNNNASGVNVAMCAKYIGYPGVGFHTLYWVEYRIAGTVIFIGDQNGSASGIAATIRG